MKRLNKEQILKKVKIGIIVKDIISDKKVEILKNN